MRHQPRAQCGPNRFPRKLHDLIAPAFNTAALVWSLKDEAAKLAFRRLNAFAAGDAVLVTDTQNRILLYSLKSGQLVGRAFGAYAEVSFKTGLVSVENESGKLANYDLATMNKRDSFTFSSPLSMLRFSPDGRRLMVLTTNQTVYMLDVSLWPRPQAHHEKDVTAS